MTKNFEKNPESQEFFKTLGLMDPKITKNHKSGSKNIVIKIPNPSKFSKIPDPGNFNVIFATRYFSDFFLF